MTTHQTMTHTVRNANKERAWNVWMIAVKRADRMAIEEPNDVSGDVAQAKAEARGAMRAWMDA